MKRWFLFFFQTAFALLLSAKTIEITSQADFDALKGYVKEAIDMGETDIKVNIKAKKLHFHNLHFLFSNIRGGNVSISIQGNGTLLLPDGRYTTESNKLTSMYLLKEKAIFQPWTPFFVSPDTIEVVDYASKTCRVSNTMGFKLSSVKKYIQFTSWYSSHIFPITKINSDWIYFDASGEMFPALNGDYSYGKCFPRYRLLGTKRTRCYECHASTLLRIENCTLRSFLFSGFRVLGSADGRLIDIHRSQAETIKILQNEFYAIGGVVLYEIESQNVWFVHNVVKGFKGDGVVSHYGSKGTKITDNIFSQCSLGMGNNYAIVVHSEDFVVSRNRVVDFCSCGIGVGIWGGSETHARCSGIVADNELFFTKDFLANIAQNSLMDTGAIYTWTRSDGIMICNNHIHDIGGMKDNRGIFCDDGTCNVTVTGNTIERIRNSYDIDLRWCDTYKEQVPDHNKGNRVANNKTAGKVRLEMEMP